MTGFRINLNDISESKNICLVSASKVILESFLILKTNTKFCCCSFGDIAQYFRKKIGYCSR